jgi:hypothetical protein
MLNGSLEMRDASRQERFFNGTLKVSEIKNSIRAGLKSRMEQKHPPSHRLRLFNYRRICHHAVLYKTLT